MCLQPDAVRDHTQASSHAVASRARHRVFAADSATDSGPVSVGGDARNIPALGLADEAGDKFEVGVVVQCDERQGSVLASAR